MSALNRTGITDGTTATVTLSAAQAKLAFDDFSYLFQNELADLRGDVEGLPNNKTVAWYKAHSDKTDQINDRFLLPMEQIEEQLDSGASLVTWQDTVHSLRAVAGQLTERFSQFTDEEVRENLDRRAVGEVILGQLEASS